MRELAAACRDEPRYKSSHTEITPTHCSDSTTTSDVTSLPVSIRTLERKPDPLNATHHQSMNQIGHESETAVRHVWHADGPSVVTPFPHCLLSRQSATPPPASLRSLLSLPSPSSCTPAPRPPLLSFQLASCHCVTMACTFSPPLLRFPPSPPFHPSPPPIPFHSVPPSPPSSPPIPPRRVRPCPICWW